MEVKKYFEWFNRHDPSSTYDPVRDDTYAARLAWFSRHVPDGARVLDDGCGEGVILGGLSQRRTLHQDSWGVDLAENAVRKASARYPKLQFRATHPDGTLPFPQGAFDVVVASEMIDHLWDPRGLFREFARVLKPRGRVLLSTGYHGVLKDLTVLLSGHMDAHYHDPRSDKIRHYSLATLRSVLEECGFTVTAWGGVGRIPGWWKCLVVAADKRS